MCASRKFPAPRETWLERKGEQPAQPTGVVTVFCQKEAQLLEDVKKKPFSASSSGGT